MFFVCVTLFFVSNTNVQLMCSVGIDRLHFMERCLSIFLPFFDHLFVVVLINHRLDRDCYFCGNFCEHHLPRLCFVPFSLIPFFSFLSFHFLQEGSSVSSEQLEHKVLMNRLVHALEGKRFKTQSVGNAEDAFPSKVSPTSHHRLPREEEGDDQDEEQGSGHQQSESDLEETKDLLEYLVKDIEEFDELPTVFSVPISNSTWTAISTSLMSGMVVLIVAVLQGLFNSDLHLW